MLKRCILVATTALAAQTAGAEVDIEKAKLLQGYLECYQGKVDGTPNSERLACYDDFADVLVRWAEGGELAGAEPCTLEGQSHQIRGNFLTITGSATCRHATFRYRLFDGEEFITSGTGYIRGFALSAITTINDVPQNLVMKYTIEE